MFPSYKRCCQCLSWTIVASEYRRKLTTSVWELSVLLSAVNNSREIIFLEFAIKLKNAWYPLLPSAIKGNNLDAIQCAQNCFLYVVHFSSTKFSVLDFCRFSYQLSRVLILMDCGGCNYDIDFHIKISVTRRRLFLVTRCL